MYKASRNVVLLLLSAFILHEYNFGIEFFQSNTAVAISAIAFTLTCMLGETLTNLGAHEKTYLKMRESIKGLSEYHDEGKHLLSLYEKLTKYGVALKDKKVYLGTNVHVFETPYKFIIDTHNVLKRVNSELEYLTQIPEEKLALINETLYDNSRRDKFKKARWEFFLKNMNTSVERDRLADKYRKAYGATPFKVESAYERQIMDEQRAAAALIPDHINNDFLK